MKSSKMLLGLSFIVVAAKPVFANCSLLDNPDYIHIGDHNAKDERTVLSTYGCGSLVNLSQAHL